MRAPGTELVDNFEVHPAVSVVIPTHNRRDLLPLTLRSALWQEGVDLEILIVDDGSTDGTAEWLAALGDERVRVLTHERPLGQSAARNAGIAACGGRWIAFLDDDDLWAPDKLAAQIGRAEMNGREWCYVGALRVDQRLDVLEEQRAPDPVEAVELLQRFTAVPATMSNIVVTADLTRAVGGFDTRFDQLADWAFVLGAARAGLPACADRPLVAYRWHGANLARDVEGLFDELTRFAEILQVKPDRAAFRRYAAILMLRSNRFARAARLFALAGLESAPRDMIGTARNLAWVGREAARRNRTESGRLTLSEWAMPASGWLDRLRATPRGDPEPT